MIPRANIVAWRSKVPWPEDAQVEQDLIISRTLVEIFSTPFLSQRLAFRGGTALNKLFVEEPYRYSEDIDLVQRNPESIGDTLSELRRVTESWLGDPVYEQSERGTTFTYRFDSEIEPVVPLSLKVEINTREHRNIYDYEYRALTVDNPWFSGAADVPTFQIDELMGTKMRALYQRKKGRDLFDLGFTLDQGMVSPERVVECFNHYLGLQELRVTRAQFEENLLRKVQDPGFREDVRPLLAGHATLEPRRACELVLTRLGAKLDGDPWQGDVHG